MLCFCVVFCSGRLREQPGAKSENFPESEQCKSVRSIQPDQTANRNSLPLQRRGIRANWKNKHQSRERKRRRCIGPFVRRNFPTVCVRQWGDYGDAARSPSTTTDKHTANRYGPWRLPQSFTRSNGTTERNIVRHLPTPKERIRWIFPKDNMYWFSLWSEWKPTKKR